VLSNKQFTVNAGVRQGSILSPFLFAVYIDHLVLQLKLSGYGCYIGDLFLGCIVYADDILLISNSISDMQDLLTLCNSLIRELNVKFNVNKSMVLRIGARFAATCAPQKLGVDNLTYVPAIKYLGITIKAGRKFNCDYDPVKSSFYRSFNTIYSKSKMNDSELVSVFLVQSVCIPIISYALEASGPNRGAILSLNNAIDNSIRKIFSISEASNVAFVRRLVGIECMEQSDKLRTCDFILKFGEKPLYFANVIAELAYNELKPCLCALDINVSLDRGSQLRTAKRLLGLR